MVKEKRFKNLRLDSKVLYRTYLLSQESFLLSILQNMQMNLQPIKSLTQVKTSKSNPWKMKLQDWSKHSKRNKVKNNLILVFCRYRRSNMNKGLSSLAKSSSTSKHRMLHWKSSQPKTINYPINLTSKLTLQKPITSSLRKSNNMASILIK